jgi:hypothetical protein
VASSVALNRRLATSFVFASSRYFPPNLSSPLVSPARYGKVRFAAMARSRFPVFSFVIR